MRSPEQVAEHHNDTIVYAAALSAPECASAFTAARQVGELHHGGKLISESSGSRSECIFGSLI